MKSHSSLAMIRKLTTAMIIGCIAVSSAYADNTDSRPQLTNLPTIYIETENHAEITSKENYVKASLYWVDAEGEKVYENNLGIRGRGNSTWNMAKKPYRLKFDKKTEFLGPDRAKAKSWTMLANYADKSLIRNAVASCIGSFAGQPFTAAAQFVDVVLNGEYLGNYQISDQMEIREKRVNITEQEDPATADSDISGGYFLEVDGFAYQEEVYITTPRGVTITVKSPDEDIINQAQINYISNFMSTFENALYSQNFKDQTTGYRKYVDPSTLASWYISSELTGNVDAFWSTYIYKEKGDDKIYWGPLWDYDIAFNNCDRIGDVTNALMTDRGFGDNLTNVWVKRMWTDPWFANLINDSYKQLVANGLEDHVIAKIDELASLLSESQARNFAKWPINQKVYNEIVLFNSYQEGIDYLKKFVRNHISYLTHEFQRRVDNLPEPEDPSEPFIHDEEYSYRLINRGCKKAVTPSDDGNSLCINSTQNGSLSQEWIFVPVDDIFYTIKNRATDKVISDVAQISGTHYAGGSALALTEEDQNDPSQHWTISPISTGNSYILVNRKTSLAWNNNGGNSNDGNPVISWTNDAENGNKHTRQWHIQQASKLVIDGIDSLEEHSPINYCLLYNKATYTLRFAGDESFSNAQSISGKVTIYDSNGQIIAQGTMNDTFNLEDNAPGTYIVVFENVDGLHSIKFLR